ncbi:MAG: hypothetical protein IJB43_01665 [Clostridia bacterium]|nr:hypothetical protein [Clostridia bacterium]
MKRRLFRAAKGEGAKTSPVRGGFTPSKRAAGRRPFEAQGEFRTALAVFRRKMEAEADKAESTFAVGKYVCGARLKELFEKSSLRIFKNFPAAVVFLIENFRVRKFTFKLRRRRILTRASRDHNLRAAQQYLGASRS